MPPLRPDEVPILAELVRHAALGRIPLHVPGHKRGRGLPSALGAWLGAAALLDLTELPGLDNLQHPNGCIAASQRLAAAHYGSDDCFYSVGGSSAGVMAALLGCLAEGDAVLLAGAFHVSAWRGLVLSGALPRLWPTPFSDALHALLPPTAADVAEALAAHPDVRAVYLTSPTYQGLVAPVAEIAKVVHQRGLPLIVDEAHGAHLGLAPGLPQHSVAAGADVVIQSVHKTLPALAQTAWVHCRRGRVDAERVQAALRLLHTTSPSYLLLASLDAAQAWLRTAGRAEAERVLQVVGRLPQAPAPDPFAWDPFRRWFATRGPDDSRLLLQALADAGVEPEYGDAWGVLCLFGFGLAARDVMRCEAALAAWQRQRGEAAEGGSAEEAGDGRWLRAWHTLADEWRRVPPAVTPREAYQRSSERVPLSACAGRVAADLITPYPPGVPLVVPGMRLTAPVRDALCELSSLVELHGLGRDGQIRVLK